jgi:hypothetical protein
MAADGRHEMTAGVMPRPGASQAVHDRSHHRHEDDDSGEYECQHLIPHVFGGGANRVTDMGLRLTARLR